VRRICCNTSGGQTAGAKVAIEHSGEGPPAR
jgi:hypothetical protein